MRINTAQANFSVEPYRSLAQGKRIVFGMEASSAIAGLTAIEARDLQQVDLFPPANCDPSTGVLFYDRDVLVAYRWALHHDPALMAAVEYWLGRSTEN